ncbi:MAG: hypothetical protein CMJ47_08450 [Planctomyces sp.]|nr:hypothetical protein [Planctomyces sp.]
MRSKARSAIVISSGHAESHSVAARAILRTVKADPIGETARVSETKRRARRKLVGKWPAIQASSGLGFSVW